MAGPARLVCLRKSQDDLRPTGYFPVQIAYSKEFAKLCYEEPFTFCGYDAAGGSPLNNRGGPPVGPITK